MFVWDDKALDALGRSIRMTRDALSNVWAAQLPASLVKVKMPAPLVRVQDKLQLECRASVLRQGRGPAQGIRIQCYGQTKGSQHRKDGRGLRLLREECVIPTTPIEDQRRIMEAMCDIVAVQEGCEYRLRNPHRAVAPVKLILRPERGRR